MNIASTNASITIMIANILKFELARCGARRTGQIHFPLVTDSVWRNDKIIIVLGRINFRWWQIQFGVTTNSLLYLADSITVGDRFSLAYRQNHYVHAVFRHDVHETTKTQG